MASSFNELFLHEPEMVQISNILPLKSICFEDKRLTKRILCVEQRKFFGGTKKKVRKSYLIKSQPSYLANPLPNVNMRLV